MKLLTPYQYLYYRNYCWYLKKWGEGELPQLNALLGVSFLTFLNIYFVLELFSFLLEIDIFKAVGWNKLYAVGLAIGILILNYLLLIPGKKYLTIAKQFRNESQSKQRVNLILCVVYIFVTIILFYIGTYWLHTVA